MGVVFGLIEFENIRSPCKLFLEYGDRNNVVMNADEPECALIDMQGVESLSVFNRNGVEIKGMATSISGSKDGGYYVEIIGIPYPFYEEEFPHHAEAYDNRYK